MIRWSTALRRAVFALVMVVLVGQAAWSPAFAAQRLQPDTDRSAVSAPPTPGPNPAGSRTEIVDERTQSSQTFDNGDGTFTTELHAQPRFYRPTPGAPFEPIEVGFERSQDASGVAVSRRAPATVSLGSPRARGRLFSVANDRYRVSVSLPTSALAAASPSDPTFEGSRADFRNVFPGVGLRVFAQALGAKSFLVLDRAPTRPEYTFLVDAPGLELAPEPDGSVSLLDAAGERVASIPRPYMVDSTVDPKGGDGRYSEAVKFRLTEVDGLPAVTIAPDPVWLATATYPVYVDPSVTYLTGTDAYGDAMVSKKNPTTNYGNYLRPTAPGYYEMWLGTNAGDVNDVYEDFFKFDVSPLKEARIDSALFDVCPYHQYYDAPDAKPTWINKITAPPTTGTNWTESTINWNNSRMASEPLSPSYVNTVEGKTAKFDVTAATQGWVNNLATNYGLKLHEGTATYTHWKRLVASEQPTATTCETTVPHLVVTWHRPTVAISSPAAAAWTRSRTLQWTYSDVHAQTDFRVEVATDSAFTAPVSGASFTGSGTATTWAIPTTVALTTGSTYYWRVRAKDGVGWSTWATSSFKWDAAPPTNAVIAVNDVPTAGTQYKLGNGSFTTKVRATEATTQSGIKVTRLRLVSGTSTPTASHDWVTGGTNCTVSTASPLVTFGCAESFNTSGTREVTYTVTGQSADARFNVQYAISDAAGNSLPDTGYGNSGHDIVFDNTPPNASISSPAETGVVGGSVTITGTAADANFHHYDLEVGAGSSPTSWSPIGTNPRTTAVTSGTLGTWNAGVLANGTYTIRLRAYDQVRTASGYTELLRRVTVDNGAPTAEITAPAAGAHVTGSVAIVGSASAASSFASYTLHYGPTCTPTTWTDIGVNPRTTAVTSDALGAWDTTALADGPYAVRLISSKVGGQTNTAAVCVTVDNTSPSGSIADPQADATVNGSITVTGTASDANFTEYRLEYGAGAAPADWLAIGANPRTAAVDTAGPLGVWEAGDLPDGTYTLRLRVYDRGHGAASPAVVLRTVTVDNAAPSASIATPVTGAYVTGSVPIDGTASATSGFASYTLHYGVTCAPTSWLDIGTNPRTTSITAGTLGSWDTSGLAEGAYAVRLVATRTGGATNTAETCLQLDRTGPTVDFGFPDEGTSATSGTSVAVDWTEADTGAGVADREFQRQRASADGTSCGTFADDGPPVSAMAPVSVTNLMGGYCYRWTVTAVDAVDNHGSSTSGTVVVDATGPAVSAPDLDAASDTGSLAPTSAPLTLRPVRDAALSNVTLSSGTTAWNLVDEATLDTTDYIRPESAGFAYFGFAAPPLDPAARIDSVTVRADVSNAPPAQDGYVAVRDPADQGQDAILTITQSASGTKSALLTTRPWDGKPWTWGDLAVLEAGVLAQPGSYARMHLHQLSIEVRYSSRTPVGFDADNRTADSTPSFSGTVGGDAVRAELYRGGTLVGTDLAVSDGTWAIASSPTADGTHAFTAKAYDAYGNPTTSAAVSVVVDTAAPAVDLSAGSDTGPLAPVDVVEVMRPNRDVAIAGTSLSAGTTAWNLIDEAQPRRSDWVHPLNGEAVVGFSTTSAAADDAIGSVTIRAHVSNTAPAYDGLFQVRDPATGTLHTVGRVRQNPSGDQTFTLTVRPWDAKPWTKADIDRIEVASECRCGGLANFYVYQLWLEIRYSPLSSGASASDDLTSDATPTLEGANSPTASRVELYRDGELIGADTEVTDGSWSVTAAHTPDGVHRFSASAFDALGNVTTMAPAVTVTIDTAAPAAPPTPDLDVASDTGLSDNDDITTDLTPTFNGANDAGVAQIEVFAGALRAGTDATVSDGAWSATTRALDAGSYAVAARATDAAGNVSARSPALQVELVEQLTALRAYSAPAGDVGSVTWVSVVTEDERRQPIDSYAGTITLSSSDPGAIFPDGPTYAMRPGQDGTGHSFRVLFSRPGNHTVSAKAAGTVSATTAPLTVSDTTLSLVMPQAVYKGVPAGIKLQPRKSNGLMARQYAGQVTLASSDPNANFGPGVDNAKRYQFDCGCGDGKTFPVRFDALGPQSITVTDAFGHTATANVTVATAPTGGVDPITSITAVQWPWGSAVDYYIAASAPFTVLGTEDMNGSTTVLSSSSLNRRFPAGKSQFTTTSAMGGHIVAGDWFEAGDHRVWYQNEQGTVFSRCTYCVPGIQRVKRFANVPARDGYTELDPGDPVQSWSVISRTDAQTTIRFTATEPFVIADVAYTFQGTIWDPVPGTHSVPAGTTDIVLSNDPARCYFGTYQPNDSIKINYVGLGSGRRGRIAAGIVTSTPGFSGSCTSEPQPGPSGQAWFDALGLLGQLVGIPYPVIADPIQTHDGSLLHSQTDFALGGLSPSLELTRHYSSRSAEASAQGSGHSGLFGPGWSSDLDWRIVEFGTDPTGVKIRGSDGRYLVFLKRSDGTYDSVGGVPFTFHDVSGGHELRRLDKGGVRFASDGRLVAFFDEHGREMTIRYDANGDVAGMTDAANRTAVVTTDGGRVKRIDLPDGRYVSYTYTNGRLATARDLSGTTLDHVTDVRGRLTAIRDGDGRELLRNIYDGQGRVIKQVDAAGSPTHLSHDGTRGTTQTFGPRGDVTTSCHDHAGHLVQAFNPLDGGRSVVHDWFGHVSSVTDEIGATSRYKNDASGRLLSATDPIGRTTQISYHADGKPALITEPTGRTLTPDYDTLRLPERVTLTSGANTATVAAYTYTTLKQLRTITEPGGGVSTFAYDARGYVETVRNPDGGMTTVTTDARGYVTRIVDPLGNVTGGNANAHTWQQTYDAMGRVLTATDPLGWTTTYTYDAFGRVLTARNPLGHTTTYAYDAAGRVRTVTTPISATQVAVTTYHYDAAGNVAATVDAEGHRTEYQYDLAGRRVAVIDADGKTWRTEYDAKGRVAASTDPTGRIVRTEYDSADRIVKTVDAGGDETTYAYDSNGRLKSINGPLGRTTSFGYDWQDRRRTVTNALNQTTTFDYDDANDLVKVTDARQHATRFAYNRSHQITNIVDAALGETTFDYDAGGQLKSRTNARGYAESFEFDALGRPTKVTDALGHVWRTAYDPAGRVDHTIDAEGQRTDFTHDRRARILTVTPATGPTIVYAYDQNGRRRSMTDGTGATSYGYDPVGRLTTATRNTRTVGYAYDGAGRVSRVDYPGELGSVAYAYDREGRMERITDWAGRATSYAYDDADRVTLVARPGSLTTTVGYDPLDRPLSIVHARHGADVLRLGYTYDAAGNIATLTDELGQATFGYDALDRLTTAVYPDSGQYAYTHDAMGNITKAVTPAGTTTRTYDAADRIADSGYDFDDNGAMTTDGTKTYSYDALGRLSGVSGPALSATYRLDGDGNRVAATINSVDATFDLDVRGHPTVLGDGARRYLPGQPSAGYEQDGVWLNALTDHQGSRLASVSEAGAVTGTVRYDPYGTVRGSASAPDGIGYAGEWKDATGLVNLRARAYAPALGRFISRDTFAGVASAPLTGNRYLYGLANPLRYTDPSGHFVAQLSGFRATHLENTSDATVSPPAVSGPTPPAAGRVVCSAALLDCSASQFEGMTMAERVTWVAEFQSLYQQGGWFNAFEGFITALRDRGYDSGSWISTVDARVLTNMQNGYRHYRMMSVNDMSPGTEQMAALFEAIGSNASDSEIRRRHVLAEQASVNHGDLEAVNQGRTAGGGEIAMLAASNTWRAATYTSATAEQQLGALYPLHPLAPFDWALDQRERGVSYEGAVNADRIGTGELPPTSWLPWAPSP